MRQHYGNFYSHRAWCGNNVVIATAYADFRGLHYDFFHQSELLWPADYRVVSWCNVHDIRKLVMALTEKVLAQ